MLQLSEIRPHTRNIHHLSRVRSEAVTIWPSGWSPGKIIYNLRELLSVKMLCLSSIQLYLKVNNLGVLLSGMSGEKGRKNGRTKPNAWSDRKKREVGRTIIKLAVVTRSRFHSHVCHRLCSATTSDLGICNGIVKVLKGVQRQPQFS